MIDDINEEVLEDDTNESDTANDTLFPSDDNETDLKDENVDETTNKRFAGKFQTVEALEEGYKNVEKILSEKREVPESYEVSERLEEAGLVVTDDEQWNEQLSEAKSLGFTQKQLDWALQKAGELVSNTALQNGPNIDTDAEIKALESVWGTETQQKGSAIIDWATRTFGSDVIKKPIGMTKEGLLFLERLQMEERGPNPMMSNNVSNGMETLEEQLSELHNNPTYNESSDAGDRIRTKAREVVAKMRRLQSRI